MLKEISDYLFNFDLQEMDAREATALAVGNWQFNTLMLMVVALEA